MSLRHWRRVLGPVSDANRFEKRRVDRWAVSMARNGAFHLNSGDEQWHWVLEWTATGVSVQSRRSGFEHRLLQDLQALVWGWVKHQSQAGCASFLGSKPNSPRASAGGRTIHAVELYGESGRDHCIPEPLVGEVQSKCCSSVWHLLESILLRLPQVRQDERRCHELNVRDASAVRIFWSQELRCGHFGDNSGFQEETHRSGWGLLASAA